MGTTRSRERAALACCTAVAVVVTVQLVALVAETLLVEPVAGPGGGPAFVAAVLPMVVCAWYAVAAVAAWITVGSTACRSPHARANVLVTMTLVACLELLVLAGGPVPAFAVGSGVAVLLAAAAVALVARARAQ
jgi:hypothetical protein